jgi:pyruvate/2-oxoglutarate dehydrogenase complex dihydrolipoamide acyltransferase (E2) component
VSVTADHRVCDGAQFAGFAHEIVARCVGDDPAAHRP